MHDGRQTPPTDPVFPVAPDAATLVTSCKRNDSVTQAERTGNINGVAVPSIAKCVAMISGAV